MTPNFRILTSVLLAALAAAASEPVEWTAKPGDGPKSFVRHHGSTLEFKCAFAGFGGAFAEASDVRLWYQTNGMGRAWWSVPATRSNEVLSASWPPSMDPGADRVSFFFGAPSNAYASAVVRLQHSPGFAPNVLTPPVSTLDFDAIEVQNPPYWTRAESDARYGGSSITASVVTNVAEAVVARDALPKADGVASGLTVDGEFRLRDWSGDGDGTIQYAGYDSDNYTEWWVGVPGYWLGTYRLRNPGSGNVATIAYTSDLPNLAPYAVAATVASNALPRAEAAQTYATQTTLTTGLAGRMSLTGPNGVDETWSLEWAGAFSIIEFLDSNWMFHGSAENAYYAQSASMMPVAGSYDGATVSDDLDGKLRMRFFRSDDGQSQDVEGWSATMSDVSALSARVESDHQDSMYTMTSATAYTARTNSVQYIDLTGLGSLTISPPPAVQGRVRDWLVYVFAEADKTDALTFGDFASLLAADASATNRTLKAGVTMFSFSEIASGRFVVGRQELTDVTPAH